MPKSDSAYYMYLSMSYANRIMQKAGTPEEENDAATCAFKIFLNHMLLNKPVEYQTFLVDQQQIKKNLVQRQEKAIANFIKNNKGSGTPVLEEELKTLKANARKFLMSDLGTQKCLPWDSHGVYTNEMTSETYKYSYNIIQTTKQPDQKNLIRFNLFVKLDNAWSL